MLESLAVGIENEQSFMVEASMVPGHIDAQVLSTPSMIQMIESACLLCSKPHLEGKEVTVGTHICVSHAGGAFVGETVEVSCRLKEINKRRLLYEVEVKSPRGSISTGTHERAVVDPDRLKK